MTSNRTTGQTAVVVAHPDDETLWLSSAIALANQIVFCFGDQHERPKKAKARRAAVAALPFNNIVQLAIPESGARLLVDLSNPRLTATGIAITDNEARERYDANFAPIVESLRAALAGCSNVYTHNPWGEYGHVDHIQIYRAVCALQEELGYTVWFTNYVDEASMPVARLVGEIPCWVERASAKTDARVRRLMKIYRRYGAWTWSVFHRWPSIETAYSQPSPAAGRARRKLIGEQLLDVAGLRWWPPPYRPACRVLR
jgi:LmbE family N-acetylglucosaminyl deacetylase